MRSLIVLLLLIPSIVLGQEFGSKNRNTVYIQTSGECDTVTFENMFDGEYVQDVVGKNTLISFGYPSWFTFLDFDAGGTGNFANEPSPSMTVALYELCDMRIYFDPPARYVKFSYSSSQPPILVASIDSNGNTIELKPGNTLGFAPFGAPCVGDPNGDFCLWDTLSFYAQPPAPCCPTGLIYAIGFGLDALRTCGFDNFIVCNNIPTTAVEETYIPSSLIKEGTYDILGRRVNHLPNGVYWEVKNGKPRKLVKIK